MSVSPYIVFMALNVADALLTAHGITIGGGAVNEANPTMALAISTFGLAPAMGLKIFVGGILTLVMHQRQSNVVWVGILLLGGAVLWNASLLSYR